MRLQGNRNEVEKTVAYILVLYAYKMEAENFLEAPSYSQISL